MKKLFLLLVISIFFVLNAHANLNIGMKYGYSYFNDYDRGTVYSGILCFPFDNVYGLEIEYGEFKDGDRIVEGKYTGGFFTIFLGYLMDLPFKLKLGYLKQDVDFNDIDDLTVEDFDDNDFSYGIGTGVRTPYFTGYIEYLKISDDIYTIAALIRF